MEPLKSVDMTEAVFDTGDTVRVLHNDMLLEVAFSEGGYFWWLGWPPGRMECSKAVLVQKADPEHKRNLLERMAEIKGDDARWRYARRVLGKNLNK